MKFLVLALLCLTALADENKKEPIVLNMTRPALTINPDGEVILEKGVQFETVVKVLVSQMNELTQRLDACEHKPISPKKKVKDVDHH